MDDNLAPTNTGVYEKLKTYNALQSKLETKLGDYNAHDTLYMIGVVAAMVIIAVSLNIALPLLLKTNILIAIFGSFGYSGLLSYMFAQVLRKKELEATRLEVALLQAEEKKLALEFFEENQLKATLQFLLSAKTPEKLGMSKEQLQEAATQLFKASKIDQEDKKIEALGKIVKSVISSISAQNENAQTMQELEKFVKPEEIPAVATIANISLQSSKYMSTKA